MNLGNKTIKTLLSGLLLFFYIAVSAKEQYEPCPLQVKDAENTIFGSYIKNLKTGEIIDNINSGFLFVPASVTKALTCASVLSQISENACFKTHIAIEGNITNGILNGNIIIQCSGDPTIESSHFTSYAGITDSIANHLGKMGINAIEGKIIFEYPFELEENVPAGWMTEDLVWPYGTAHHALNFADNRLVLNFADGSTKPPTSSLSLKRETGAKLHKLRNEKTIIASAKTKGSMQIAAPDPEDVFSTVLIESLNKKNIEYTYKDNKGGENRTPIYTHTSPSYAEIMKSLMWRSDNLMAEGMLRTLSPTRWRKSATQRELSLWNARGLDVTDIYVEDGSGLSRRNRISPKFLSDVLEWMNNSPDADLYVSFFPRAGKEGTMRNFLTNSPLEGLLATKTGSMNSVQCFAGYILDENGKPSHIITIMVNAFKCNRASLKKEIGNYILSKLGLNQETSENEIEN